jgi:hypothetical protein
MTESLTIFLLLKARLSFYCDKEDVMMNLSLINFAMTNESFEKDNYILNCKLLLVAFLLNKLNFVINYISGTLKNYRRNELI